MHVPLGALSWALIFFWIITIAVAITCVYSATLIRVSLGEPMMTYGENFTLTLPIIIDNRGYYTISDLNITMLTADSENHSISMSSTFVSRIPPQDNTTILHNISLGTNEILSRTDYLFSDSDFALFAYIRLNYANLVPFTVETNTSLPWGAPLFNLTIGVPEYQAYDAVQQIANVPVSFQNHSPYINVTGTIRIDIFNDRNQLLGTGAVVVDVPSNVAYNGEIQAIIDAARATGRGELHVYFETEAFSYGPVVVDCG